MNNTQCPYCYEAVKPEAKICKHCHSIIKLSREEKLLWAIQRRLNPEVYNINDAALEVIPLIGSVSPCVASCYRHRDRQARQECIDDCKAIEAIAMIVARAESILPSDFVSNILCALFSSQPILAVSLLSTSGINGLISNKGVPSSISTS